MGLMTVAIVAKFRGGKAARARVTDPINYFLPALGTVDIPATRG